jgi:hypothetical protein
MRWNSLLIYLYEGAEKPAASTEPRRGAVQESGPFSLNGAHSPPKSGQDSGQNSGQDSGQYLQDSGHYESLQPAVAAAPFAFILVGIVKGESTENKLKAWTN